MILSSQLGLINFLYTDTISSHPWNKPNDWVLMPSGGWVNPPSDYNSTWELKPPVGKVYIVTACQIQMSSDVVLSLENSMNIAVSIHSSLANIPITKFVYADEFLNRASEVHYYPVQNIVAGSFITKPFYRTVIPFAQKIFLWGSAGINPDTSQPYTDRLGNIKFRSMVAKIANDSPYRNSNNDIVETCWSRYFVEVYSDPDHEG